MEVRDILDDLGIEVTGESHSRDGHIELSACCPHHHGGTRVEHNPSWSINADTGIHFCHGCGFTGSLEYLVAIVTGTTIEDAARKTARGERHLKRLLQKDPWGGERPVEVPPMTEARVGMYDEPPAWALTDRRLDAESARRYGVRWSDSFVHGQEAHPNCWVVPIRWPRDGRIMGMQVKQQGGRFFRNLPHTVAKSSTLYGIEHAAGTVVVVESPLDAVYLSRLGYSAVSTFGARISDIQMELLIEHADRLILALDDDEAGWKEVRRVLGLKSNGRPDPKLLDYSQRIQIRIANYAEALNQKDVGECPPSIARAVIDSNLHPVTLRLTA